MSTSETGLQLRNRGLGIAAAGLLAQLIGVLIVVSTSGWAILLIPLVIAAVVTALSYTSVKDRTGTANVCSTLTVLIAAVAAIVNHGWAGVSLVLIGTVISYVGNKQLAAGIRY